MGDNLHVTDGRMDRGNSVSLYNRNNAIFVLSGFATKEGSEASYSRSDRPVFAI